MRSFQRELFEFQRERARQNVEWRAARESLASIPCELSFGVSHEALTAIERVLGDAARYERSDGATFFPTPLPSQPGVRV